MTDPATKLEPHEGPLVSTEWLQAALGHERLRVLDVRGRHASSPLPHAKRTEYAQGHIPGAVFVDWERDFVAVEDPVPLQVAATREFAERAGELGVGDGDLVVTYDDYYGIFAARVAWAFRLYGARSWVLDGGWTTWREEGRDMASGIVEPAPAQFHGHLRSGMRRTLDDVERARSRGAVLVDARPRHLYLGEEGRANTGHIPGALCIPYQELVDGATGLWAAPEAVARLARDAGVDPENPPRELITTCGSGVSATVAMLALERIGISTAGVYDGSFNEWSADPARAVSYGSVA